MIAMYCYSKSFVENEAVLKEVQGKHCPVLSYPLVVTVARGEST